MGLTGYIFVGLCVSIIIYSIWPRTDKDKGMVITHLDYKTGKTSMQPKRYNTWWEKLMEWLPQSVASGSFMFLIGFLIGRVWQ